MDSIGKMIDGIFSNFSKLKESKMAENDTGGVFSTLGTILKLVLFLVTFIFTVLAGAVLLFYNLYQQEREENDRLKTDSAAEKKSTEA